METIEKELTELRAWVGQRYLAYKDDTCNEGRVLRIAYQAVLSQIDAILTPRRDSDGET